MEIMEQSAILKNNHYQLNLPFKKDVCLLNNFSMAKHGNKPEKEVPEELTLL